MSDSVRPHRWQPTRLPHPWDSPGQEHWSGLPFPSPMCESEVAQSCPTLSDPMDCSLPGYSVHGIFQARVLEWGAILYITHLFIICFIELKCKLQKAKDFVCFLQCLFSQYLKELWFKICSSSIY